jgi:hypothetical protein
MAASADISSGVLGTLDSLSNLFHECIYLISNHIMVMMASNRTLS